LTEHRKSAQKQVLPLTEIHTKNYETENNSMSNDLEINKSRVPTPSLIYAACTLGFLGTIPTLLLWTTELAYMVGQWYKSFLLISSFLIWVSLAGIWYMKKWAAVTYSLIIIATQIILFKYNVMWSYTSLIVPSLVTLVVWFYFRKMT